MKRCVAVLIALALLMPATAFAGGWTQEEGNYYLKVWTRLLVGNSGFLTNGEIAKLEGDFTDINLNLYTEYGLTNNWTLVAFGTPFGIASGHHPEGSEEDDSTNYSGGANVGIRRALLGEGPLRLAVEAHYGYTPGVSNKAIASGVIPEGEPGAGEPYVYIPGVEAHRLDGEFQAGYGLPKGMWLAATLGYRHFISDEDLDPAIYGFAQYGWSNGTVVLDFHSNLYEPTGETAINNISGAGQTRYLGFGVGASYWFTPHIAANLGLEGVAYAESNAATPTLAAGIELR